MKLKTKNILLVAIAIIATLLISINIFNIYDNYIYVFNYEKLITLTSVLIILKLDNFNIEIKGTNLVITKMMPSEILIKGKIKNVGFNYE